MENKYTKPNFYKANKTAEDFIIEDLWENSRKERLQKTPIIEKNTKDSLKDLNYMRSNNIGNEKIEWVSVFSENNIQFYSKPKEKLDKKLYENVVKFKY